MMATEEDRNFMTVRHALDKPCTYLLQEVLRQHVPEKDMHKLLNDPVKKRKMIPILRKLNQEDTLYPKTGVFGGSYSDFDLTLLYVLIRNLTGIPDHKTGWGNEPDINDNSTAANIDRLRLLRNKYAHGSTIYLTDKELKRERNNIISCIHGIEKTLPTKTTTFEDAAEKIFHPAKKQEDLGESITKCQGRTDTLLVVAIDFGTTYSGYTCQFRSDYTENPFDNILTPFWSGKYHKLHEKTASSLLLNPDESFNSFGFEAEENYSSMWQDYINGEFKPEKYPDNKTPSDWFFFRHFKMHLYRKKNCNNDMTIKDETGNKKLPLQTVIRESIAYFKKHAEQFLLLKENAVQWVLTLPAICNNSQKEFMKSAAKEAGIPNESLIIAIKSEAAALLTKEQKLCRQEKNGKVELLSFTPDSNLMVIDLGGGTVDTTILQGPKTTKKMITPTGLYCGGNKVNDAFMQIWIELLGDDFTNCKDRFPDEVLDLWQNFEVKKRGIGESFGTDYLSIPVPECCREISHFKEKFENSAKYPGIKVNRGTVYFPNRLIEKLFMTTINEIISHVSGLLDQISVDAIILVGGFSESKFVFKSMKNTFKDISILRPHERSLSVLKGALLYGFQFLEHGKNLSLHSYE